MKEATEILFLAHCAVTWALVGLVLTVHVVCYPLFMEVGRDCFAKYHADYTRRIGWIVAPLMLAELATAAALLMFAWRQPLFLVSLLFLAGNWLSTAFVQVPLHRRLAAGFDETTARTLVVSNRIRVTLWLARGLMLLGLLGDAAGGGD